MKKFLEFEKFETLLKEKREAAQIKLNLCNGEEEWIVITGEASSSTYNVKDENIQILFKDGTVRDISQVDDALINAGVSAKIKKYYICYLRD